MFGIAFRLLAGLLLMAFLAPPLISAEKPAADSTASPAKHTLRYKFRPGETVRWQVEQRVEFETTMSGNTQSAELLTRSVKVWQIKEVSADGKVTLENLAEDVEMRQKLTGRAETRYNSKTDKTPPLGFEHVAQTIGVPLARITLDSRGIVLKREHLAGANPENQELLTPILPEQPVAVGESWSIPADFELPLQGKMVKRVKALQKYALESVTAGTATIRMVTQVLTPIDDPAVEFKMMDRDSTRVFRFDVAAGRLVDQQRDIDKRLVGFRGAASSLHYRMRLSEKLLDGKPPAPDATAAAKPKPKPEPSADGDASDASVPKTPAPAARSAKVLHAVPPEPASNSPTRR
jgi:hypothetical protein